MVKRLSLTIWNIIFRFFDLENMYIDTIFELIGTKMTILCAFSYFGVMAAVLSFRICLIEYENDKKWLFNTKLVNFNAIPMHLKENDEWKCLYFRTFCSAVAMLKTLRKPENGKFLGMHHRKNGFYA